MLRGVPERERVCGDCSERGDHLPLEPATLSGDVRDDSGKKRFFRRLWSAVWLETVKYSGDFPWQKEADLESSDLVFFSCRSESDEEVLREPWRLDLSWLG